MNTPDDFISTWKPCEKENGEPTNFGSSLELVCRPGGEILCRNETPDAITANLSLEKHFAASLDTLISLDSPRICIGTLNNTTVNLTMTPPAPSQSSETTLYSKTFQPVSTCSNKWVSIRSCIGRLSHPENAAVTRAAMLSSFIYNHQYCGRCSAPVRLNNTETSCTCIACGFTSYPQISPAIIALIMSTDGSQILLARNRNFPSGLYSCIAGFVDAGESAENAVKREIKEEIGLENLNSLRYITSQPWPFPHSLMLGYEVKASGIPKPNQLEIVEAHWFTAHNLPQLPKIGSISRLLVNQWLRTQT